MPETDAPYPVVDVFAGPGGLGEGFASLDNGKGEARFENAVSIERDNFSYNTLRLRHFLRTFPHGAFPEEYYRYLKSEISIDDLYELYPRNKASAESSALQISLGPENHERVRKIIHERLNARSKWVLVGGPPCQAYSLAGRSRMMGDSEFQNDIRHFLYREYLQIIVDHSPPVFVMENVKGLLSAKVKEKQVIDRILHDLNRPREALGEGTNGLAYKLYSLTEDETWGSEVDPRLFLVRAEEYGVPQARHRIFILGVREDIGVKPKKLTPHSAPTLEETIGNLPHIRSGLSKGGDSQSAWRNAIKGLDPTAVQAELNGHQFTGDLIDRINSVLVDESLELERSSSEYPPRLGSNHSVFDFICDDFLDVLTGHETRGHMPSDLCRYAFASSFAAATGRSPKLSDFPESLMPNHKNIGLGREGKMFSDRFRVQLPDKPATTITSHISKDGHYFIHYDPAQCRSLTVREAARIQTFPDNYKFEGPRTAQYHQVGNAVPPYLSRQIATVIAEVLDRAGEVG